MAILLIYVCMYKGTNSIYDFLCKLVRIFEETRSDTFLLNRLFSLSLFGKYPNNLISDSNT